MIIKKKSRFVIVAHNRFEDLEDEVNYYLDLDFKPVGQPWTYSYYGTSEKPSVEPCQAMILVETK